MMPRLNKIIVIFLANLLLNSCAKKEEKVFTFAEYEAAAAHMAVSYTHLRAHET